MSSPESEPKSQESSRSRWWNAIFLAVVIVGGFFALLAPCLYFRGFTERDSEYLFLRSFESPEEGSAADVFRYLAPEVKGRESVVIELRRATEERGSGTRIFVAAPDIYGSVRWRDEKNLEIRYRGDRGGRKPDRMVWRALGVEIDFVRDDQ